MKKNKMNIWLKLKKNLLQFTLIIVCVCAAVTDIFHRSSFEKWENWELVAIASTVIYIGVFYCYFIKNKHYKTFFGLKLSLFALPLFGAFILTAIMLNEYLRWLAWPTTKFLTLGCITLALVCFLLINVFFCWHFNKIASIVTEYKKKKHFLQMKDSFKNAVLMSDLPLSVAFLVLTIYCYVNYGFGKVIPEMRAFFSGAIALQMLLSNFIWILNDDTIVNEKSPLGKQDLVTILKAFEKD